MDLPESGIGESTLSAVHSPIWVVVPAHNESKSISNVLSDLVSNGRIQVVLVDDGSSDETAHLACRFFKSRLSILHESNGNRMFVLRHMINRGQGAALQTGIDFSVRNGAQIIVTFDADGQHCAKDIPTLVAPLMSGEADVCLGSRFLGKAEGIPISRWLLLKAAVLLTRITTGLKLTDSHNGLRAFSHEAARKLRLSEDGMAHASEFLYLIAKHHLRFREIPCTIRYTELSLQKGQSNRAAFGILFRMLISRITR